MCMYVCTLACMWAHVHAWACHVEARDQESTSAASLRLSDPEHTDMTGSAEQIAGVKGNTSFAFGGWDYRQVSTLTGRLVRFEQQIV